jgi:hypothetical protein
MQTAVFYGCSDDLIEIEGVKGGDEFGCYRSDDNPVRATFNLGDKMRLWCIYDGCWSFAVGQVDEEGSAAGLAGQAQVARRPGLQHPPRNRRARRREGLPGAEREVNP